MLLLASQIFQMVVCLVIRAEHGPAIRLKTNIIDNTLNQSGTDRISDQQLQTIGHEWLHTGGLYKIPSLCK
jgi:hypothetical protein